MKKLAIFLVIVMAVTFAKAQKVKVQNAFNFLNNGQLDKAKTNIDEACESPDTKDMAKTWLYKGNVYLAIHVTNNVTTQPGVVIGSTKEQIIKKLGKPQLDSANKLVYPDESKYKLNLFFEDGKLKYYTKDGKYKNLDNNAIETAYEAYQKAFELDTKKEYKDQLDVKLFICGSSFFDKGALLYNSKKYKEAIDYFDRTAKINSMVGYTDTLATYYAALSSELSDQPAKAKDYYQKLIKANYKKPAIYSSLANIYKNEKDSTNAFKYIKKGLDAFPGDLDLMVTQTYVYITFGKIQQALANLKSVTDKDKSNARLYYVVGVCCDNIINDSLAKQADKDEASALGESAYQKATELKPDFFDAFYYYGALYVNKAATIYSAADKLPLSAKKEYDEKRAAGDVLLNKALIPLEKAIALQPDDLPTLNALKQIYTMLKMVDKLKATNTKIDQLKKK